MTVRPLAELTEDELLREVSEGRPMAGGDAVVELNRRGWSDAHIDAHLATREGWSRVREAAHDVSRVQLDDAEWENRSVLL